MKSDIFSQTFRDLGNDRYRSGLFRDALIAYNQSLCYSESRKLKALAYANRSAVYYEFKKYKLCLDNIQLALDYGYPVDKMSKLNERKHKCKKLINNYHGSFKDPWNFFKLSYPANKKIPFIVDCLELREDLKCGRHIITSRDLEPGDIIAIEEPYIKHLIKENCYERCHHCLKTNDLSLVPCKEFCVDTMFCSKKCVIQSNQRHGNCVKSHNPLSILDRTFEQSMRAAGGLCKLQVLMMNSDRQKTIFDFNMTNEEDEATQINCLQTYLALSPGRLEELEEHAIIQQAPYGFEATVLQFARINNHNAAILTTSFTSTTVISTCFGGYLVGSGVFLFSALINESCDPNINFVYLENKMVAVVQLPIKAGEKLFCKRCPDLAKFTTTVNCACDACKSGKFKQLPPSLGTELVHFKIALEFGKVEDLKLKGETSKDSLMKLFKENCEEIKRHFQRHPCRETLFLLTHNAYILYLISNLGSI